MATLLHRLNAWAVDAPETKAQCYKSKGIWRSYTVTEMRERVTSLAKFFKAKGFGVDDVGLIFAYNSPGWTQCDLAMMLAGGASAGIYTNASEHQVQYVLNHSEAKVLIVENERSFRKIFNGRDVSQVAPNLSVIVDLSNKADFSDLAVGVESAIKFGKQLDLPPFGSMLGALKTSNPALLIYTSGTTGDPKAVVLSHDNLVFAADCYCNSWQPPKHGKMFSFLPLPHIAERMANIGVGITNRYAVYFASSPLGIVSELEQVQPTIVLCVPRFWDKLKEGVENKLMLASDKKQKLVRWAMKIGYVFHCKRLRGQRISVIEKLNYQLADKLVLSKIRKSLGLLGALRTVSGAAALSGHTVDWFRSIGIIIFEAYALSESSGVLARGLMDKDTAGTVGIGYEGVEIKIAADGEICTRGRHVFGGYYKDTETTNTMLKEGWLHTGDIGEFDNEGYLQILGRKREIIKNAEGKMVSPLPLEAQLQALSLVDQAVVIGDEKPYLTALITLTDSIDVHDIDQLIVEDEELNRQVRLLVNKINLNSAKHEKIRKFKILGRNFSIDSEEMTATYKIRRKTIESKYAQVIDSMY